MLEPKEEAGALIEEAERCESALPLMTENGEDVWCKEKGIICYKVLGEPCDDENPAVA